MSDKKLNTVQDYAEHLHNEHARALNTLSMGFPAHIAASLANSGLTLSDLF